MSTPVPITTGAARIVWGNPLIAKPKTGDDKKPILDPQTGAPIMQWAFGIAIPKHEFAQISAAMGAAAASVYPQGVPPAFSWKVKDGDGYDDQGKPYNTREGYAGCYVLSISTEAFAPRCVRLNGGAYVEMQDGIKTGDYVRVALSIKAHAGKANVRGSKPGIYLNPQMVEFLGYGEAIMNGPDAMTVFGGQQVALPPGASAVPLAPQGAMPAAPGYAPQHGGQPMQPAYAPQGAPAGYPTMPQHAPGTPMAHAPAAGQPGTPPAGWQAPPAQTAYPSNPQGQQGYAPAAPPAPPAHDFVRNAAPGYAPQPGQPGAAPAYAPQPAAASGYAPQGAPGYAPMPGQPAR